MIEEFKDNVFSDRSKVLEILDDVHAATVELVWNRTECTTDAEVVVACDYESYEIMESTYGSYIAYFDSDDRIAVAEYRVSDESVVYDYVFVYTPDKVSVEVVAKGAADRSLLSTVQGTIDAPKETECKKITGERNCVSTFTGIWYIGICTLENGRVKEFEWHS